jgi:hypothetical protein
MKQRGGQVEKHKVTTAEAELFGQSVFSYILLFAEHYPLSLFEI